MYAPSIPHVFAQKAFLGEGGLYVEAPRGRNFMRRPFFDVHPPPLELSETGRIRFWRIPFQTPSSVSFCALTEFGERVYSAYY